MNTALVALDMLLPDYAPWGVAGPLGLAGLIALIYTAWVDARTGVVPPVPLITAGMVLLVLAGWHDTTLLPELVLPALGFYFSIWGLNMAWRLLYKHDALGMGDASWTLVATLAYGWRLVVLAWAAGAILAMIYLSVLKIMHRPQGHVYFVPYLLAGLLLALAAVRL